MAVRLANGGSPILRVPVTAQATGLLSRAMPLDHQCRLRWLPSTAQVITNHGTCKRKGRQKLHVTCSLWPSRLSSVPRHLPLGDDSKVPVQRQLDERPDGEHSASQTESPVRDRDDWGLFPGFSAIESFEHSHLPVHNAPGTPMWLLGDPGRARGGDFQPPHCQPGGGPTTRITSGGADRRTLRGAARLSRPWEPLDQSTEEVRPCQTGRMLGSGSV